MKTYIVIKTDCLIKMLDSFGTPEELEEFGTQLSSLIEEIIFAGNLSERNMDKPEFVRLMTMKQLFLFTLFCRNNVDLIHDLISKIDYTEITEEERNEILKTESMNDLDSVDG